MRCKKHVSDFSSSVGVCASCLRQRLEAVVEAQSQPKSLISDNPNPNCNHSQPLSSNQLHNHRHQLQQKQEAPPSQPPPLIFPRSVSPYISRRKSDQTTTAAVTAAAASVANNDKKPIIQRFYSTPQVGPTFQKKKSGGKFSLITKLFRSKSSVVSSASNSVVGSGEFSRCRGMSPQNEWEELEEREREAMSRPSPGRVKASPARLANNVANFAFCLSPLVRASPASRFHWGVEPSFSGEIRVPSTGKSNGGSCNNKSSNNEKPHLYEAASFCANRSRKLADFGRLSRNR